METLNENFEWKLWVFCSENDAFVIYFTCASHELVTVEWIFFIKIEGVAT